MAYYSVSMHGGEREERKAVRELFGGRPNDYTGHEGTFYMERGYDIRQLRANLSGVTPEGVEVTVKRISEREYNWRKYR